MRMLVGFAVMLCVVAGAQEPARPAVHKAPLELPGKMQEHQKMFEKMGIPEDQAALLAVVTGGELDPMKLMLAMMMLNRGEMDGDAFGFMMLMNGMGKGNGPEPIWFREGETMWVLEDGTLYKINFETMEIEGRLQYRANADLEAATLGALVKMLTAQEGGPGARAGAAACGANLKQLGLAVHMYAAEHDGTLPGEDWVVDLEPYHKNPQILVCPAREGLAVGYAMNERVLGAKMADIVDPAQTVLLFEAHIGGDNPVGNAADVPEVGIHDGMVSVGFVDGHVKLMVPEETRRLLGQPVFR